MQPPALFILTDDDNRIALEALPSEVTEEDDEDSDYINAYMGDYINASYIDVSWIATGCLVCVCACVRACVRVCVCVWHCWL